MSVKSSESPIESTTEAARESATPAPPVNADAHDALQAGTFITPTVRLVRPLAEGGMGRVWVAEHLGLESQVVVKMMASEMAARPDGAERFAREAAIAAAIKSPHVVQVFDHGITAQGVPYIVMELLEGKDLGAHLAEHGRMDPFDVVTLVVQIGKALSKAHKASIVHRDIKPDNIFLCETDDGHVGSAASRRKEIFVKLLDFGTAKRDRAVDPLATSAGAASEKASRTTIPGQIMGTPYYMSPEQSIGAELDERSDIWSLGVVVFEALTNRKPFDGSSIGAITVAIHGVLPKMTTFVPELPAELDAWFARACAQKPEDRFATVREATNAFIESVTGAAPVDQPTDSIALPHFPRAKKGEKGSSSPIPPITRSTHPQSLLIETLPKRGSERKATTIAAAVVMGVAALAMVGIVASNRGSSSSATATATGEVATATTTTTRSAETASPPPPPAPIAPPAEPEPTEPPKITERSATPSPVANHKTKPSAPVAAAPLTKTAAQGVPVVRPAAHKDAKDASAAPAPRTSSAPAGHEDDDLVRLSNAASKHSAEPAPPPPPAPSPAPEKQEKAPPPAIPPLPAE